MAETLTLTVEMRDPKKNVGTGSRAMRRLRAAGRVPGIVYGHKKTPTAVALTREDAWEIIKRSTHLAQLQIDGQTEMVLVREVQWDHLGKEIIHFDFSRVSAEESIEIEVRLELRGTAPGTLGGGILEQLIHKLTLTCLANAIPDSIRADVSHLELNQAIHVRDLTLPPGVKVDADPDQLLVHVVPPRVAAPEPAAVEAEATSAEPELIGRKPEDKEKEGEKEKEKDKK
ncbi:MAG TPA: 50S ribosomal protein L25 [Isosphaeraceae bacterium]|nr:50S ribosomal protein L25 [Isosphaeraceae bacterium]